MRLICHHIIHLVLFSCLLLPSKSYYNSYHLSANAFTWNSSETFCIDHCESTLASIHSLSDQNHAIAAVTDDIITTLICCYDVWLGLNDISTDNVYEWNDLTSFDYGNNISGGIYPWQLLQPSAESINDCVKLLHTDNYKWDDVPCNENNRFLCNGCNKLSKYIVSYQPSLTWSESQTYCRSEFGTDLASMHSLSDHTNAVLLCKLVDTAQRNNCWFGLNDVNSEGIYKWSDGTTFDYGTDISGGQFPWGYNALGNEPNDWNGQDCLRLWGDNTYDSTDYRWDDAKCSGEDQDYGIQNYLICNKPSELCYQSQWTVINGAFAWSTDRCGRVTNDGGIGGYMYIDHSNNKQWTDMIIEYTFSITAGSGVGGLLFHMQSVDDYYYVNLDNSAVTDQVVLGICTISACSPLAQSDLSFSMIFDINYRLKIEITSNAFTVFVQDVQYILYTHASNTYSFGTIGILTENIDTISISLHLTGTRYLIPTFLPTTHPTIHPTTHPTAQPTMHPTNDPTKDPTNDPTNDTTNDSTTNNPTFDATNGASANPTEAPSIFNTDSNSVMVYESTSTTVIMNSDSINDNKSFIKDSLFMLLCVMSGVGLVCCIMLVVLVCLYGKKLDKQNEEAQIATELIKTSQLDPVHVNVIQQLNKDNNHHNGINDNYSTLKVWLANIGLTQYYDLFVEQNITHSQLQCLNDNNLQEMGIINDEHRKLILEAILEQTASINALPKEYDDTSSDSDAADLFVPVVIVEGRTKQ